MPERVEAMTTEPRSWEALLRDPQFEWLLKTFSRRLVTWDEFLEMPLPKGMSAGRTWRLISAMSKAIGIDVPINDPEGTHYWYTRTYEFTDTVQRLAAACQSGSRIHNAITASGGEHFIMRMRMDEAVASAHLAGLEIDRQSITRLLTGGSPQDATERLLSNAAALEQGLARFVDEPFSAEMFCSLRDALLDGIGEDELPRNEPRLGLRTYSAGQIGSAEFARRHLESIAAYANHTTGDPFDHPVLRAHLIAFSLHSYQPLGVVGPFVGRIVTGIYSLKHDLPVLGLLALSRLKIDWEAGIIGPPLVYCDRETFSELRRNKPGDLSVLQALTAQLMRLAVSDMEGYIDEWERRDTRMRELLRQDPGINQRQRSIVARALRSPDAEFTIRYHERNHAIAYATARRDFLELTGKGYLDMTQRGKSFVFTASSTLASMLEREEQEDTAPRAS